MGERASASSFQAARCQKQGEGKVTCTNKSAKQDFEFSMSNNLEIDFAAGHFQLLNPL